MINGITEGEYTNREVEIEVVDDSEYTITLDDKAYELGTSIEEGKHVIKVVDKAFNETVVNFTIDRTAPTAEVTYSTTELTNGNVTIILTANEEVEVINAGTWNPKEGYATEFKKVYPANQTQIVTIRDKAGNESVVEVVIENIDKTAPTAEVTYSTTELTNGNVTIILTANEEVEVINAGTWNPKEGYATEFKKVYPANQTQTVTIRDRAGNESTVEVVVNNIDKTAPQVIGIKQQYEDKENGRIKVTITTSEEIFGENIDSNTGWRKVSATEYYTYYYRTKEVTLNFTDKAGNQGSYTFTVDKTAPVITLKKYTKDNKGQVVEPGYYNFSLVAFVEDEDIESIKLNGEDYVPGTEIAKRTNYVLEAKDRTGNTTTINFTIDKDYPIIEVNGSKYEKVNKEKLYFKENIAPVIKDENIESIKLNGEDYISGTEITEEKEYVLEAKDKVGNMTSITFIIDKTAPVVYENNSTGTNDVFSLVNLKLYDKVGIDKLTIDGKEYPHKGNYIDINDGHIVTFIEGKHVIEFSDKAGNLTTYEFTVDKTSPKLQPSYWTKTVEANKEITEFTDLPEVVGTDENGGEVIVNLLNNTVNMAIPGEYKLQYETIDQAGNKAYNDIFVTVVDTTAPTITLKGETNITVEAGSEYVDAGIEVTDNAEGKITESYKVFYSKDGADSTWTDAKNNEVNTKVVGSYNIWYEAKDESGNTSSIRRTVKVVDTTAPEIKLNGEANITIEAGIGSYEEKGATVIDNADEMVENLQPVYVHYSTLDGKFEEELKTVDSTRVGIYKVVYKHTDTSGNIGLDANDKRHDYVIRIVKVVDTTAPEIKLNGEANITIEAGIGSYEEKGATVIDNADEMVENLQPVYVHYSTLDGKFEEELKTVDSTRVGIYKVVYKHTDTSGNVGLDANDKRHDYVIRTVKVVDTTKPEPSVVEILTLEAFNGNTEYAKSGKTIRVYLTFNEEIASQKNGTWGTYFGLFKVNGEELPLRKDSYNEESNEYNYIASYTIPEDAIIEDGPLAWSVEIFGDMSGNTIDSITKSVNARPGRTQIIYDNTVPGKVSTTYTPSDLTNQSVTVTIRVDEVITPVEGWTLSDDKMAISKTFSENINGNVVISDLAGNSETRYFSIKNIDKESPIVDTLRVKGLKEGQGTTNFKKIKVGDTFQVILTTVEELGTLPVLVIDGKEITDIKVNKFDTYYQYIASYKIPEDTTLIDGEEIAFVLKGYTDKAGNPGIDLTNDNIEIGNGQTEVIFDKSAPVISIDRNITLHVGDNFVDDIREKIFDNVTSVENLYVGGGWGTFKDTSVAGNYYLNYKIMDEAGNYSVTTRNITVVEP